MVRRDIICPGIYARFPPKQARKRASRAWVRAQKCSTRRAARGRFTTAMQSPGTSEPEGRSPLTVEPAKPMTPDDARAFGDMIARIYAFARAQHGETLGAAYMTWDMDLRARGFALQPPGAAAPEPLVRWVFTPHMNAAREQVAAAFAFHFAGRVERYFVRQAVSFKGMQLYLDGLEFERVFPEDAAPPVPAAEWDDWGKGNSRDVLRRYETTIYPRVVETVKRAAARSGGGALDVVDLGGGNGALAAALCAEVPAVARVRVVERSRVLVDQARARAAAHEGRMSVERGDLEDARLFDGEEGTRDVAILCGVVAMQVMGRGAGIELVRRTTKLLRPRGLVLVPSHSPALLSRVDYEALGLHVHNASFSYVEPSPRGPTVATVDYYVLEKVV
jgi:SAM-dependent methyltransferase